MIKAQVDPAPSWFGVSPKRWTVKQVRYVANLRSGEAITSEDIKEEGTFPVYGGNGLRGFASRWTHEGDLVLIGRQGALCGNVNVGHGRFFASEHAIVATPTSPAETGWLSAAFEAMNLRQYSVAAAQPGLSVESISRLLLPTPPLDEQRQIAEYLDRETGKIDELIAKQQQLVTTLTERRGVVISNAVSRGIDPDAKLIQSGIDWIGEMPAHWRLQQVKHLSPVKRGASPRPIDDPKYFDEDGEWAWVRIADATASGGRLTSTVQTLSDLGSSLSVKLQPGSLFVSIAGTVGKPCVTQIKACIHDGFVYFPGLTFSRDLLFRIFEAGRCYAGLGKLGTQLNLNTDTIGSIQIPVPAPREQDEIVDYLDRSLLKIDNLVAKSEHVVEILRERRAALISAAVTGKIDVRGL